MRDECGLYNHPYTSTAIKSVWLLASSFPVSVWLSKKVAFFFLYTDDYINVPRRTLCT